MRLARGGAAADATDDATERATPVHWLDVFDGTECQKFSVVDPSIIAQQGAWLAAGAAVDADSEPAEDTQGDLAKKSQNPISDMISLPFQNNFNFGVGACGNA